MLRVFIGDREPLLATAARWLVEEGSPPLPRGRLPLLDLEPLLIVVPGRRAGRRLLERLVVSAPGGAAALVPPTVVTPGVLPELIGPIPQLPLATELEALWVRIETLRQSSPALLETLLPFPPEHADLLAWLDIARELEQLDDELAAECKDTEDVSRVLERDGAPEGELRRWRCLSDLRRGFEEQLSGRGRSARSRARLHVLAAAERRARPSSGTEETRPRGSLRRVVLVGVADLPLLFRRLLLASGLDLVVLVPAPAERAGDFDDFGCPRPEVFLRRELRDAAASILVADRPLAQAAVAAECVARWTTDGDHGCSEEALSSSPVGWGRLDVLPFGIARHARARRALPGQGPAATAVVHGRPMDDCLPEDVTMAAPSVESVALLADSLERAGLPYHVPTGRRLRDSQPAVLLRRLADYLGGGSSIEALGDLLRLPVVDEAFTILAEAALPALLAEEPSAGTSRRLRSAVAERRFLAAFDCFVETCLAPVVGDALPGDPLGAAVMRAADRAVREIAGAVGREPQRASSGRRVAAILERAFGRHPLDLRVAADAETAAALELLAERLHQLDALPELDPGAELSTILRFLLATLEDVRLEETAGHGGVEIVGWLELPLDDAPRLVVVDLVEGLLPASGVEDTFLPNSLRARLGLMDDRRRLSRDLHLLEVALASREQVVLATRRREADGQPSRPSRLLLRRHGAALGERIDLLLRSPPAAAPHDLWPRVATSGFQVPRPQPAEVLRALPVTAFDDYLACPYRFYLTRVLRLEVARERPHELDGAAFGALAHDVLRRFALGTAAYSEDAAAIEVELLGILRGVTAESLRGAVPTAARVQVAQLERRLRVFAAWQAEQVRQGWRIEPAWVEASLSGTIVVDAEPFELHGRVDRIDSHPVQGYRIVDYKTSDRPESPAAKHGGPRDANGRRRTDGRPWRSLQLPLYAYLARSAGLDPRAGDTKRCPELGFYALSKKLGAQPWLVAPWEEEDLDAAVECARWVVRRIRAQVFWPPGPPPRWDDGLAGIVGDRYPSRYRGEP